MMHTRTENDRSIVTDIPYPIWEQLMNQGDSVMEISVPSQPIFDSNEQKASGSTTTYTTVSGTE